ncbi:MAG: hypothetical protein IAG10_01830 [Planctomycetaceae bacterium]|nr:hypothetical protein [Planctomycetaceae bacterium]
MKRKTKVIVGIVLAAALLAGFVMFRKDLSLEKQSSVTEMYGGVDGLMTVTHPQKVEAYRLKPNLKYDGTEYTDPNDNYEVIAGPALVPETVLAEVSAVLVSPRSYGWDYAKACMPRYGVRLSFQRGADQVEVYLCFECKILLVTRNASVTGGGNFDPMNATLVRAAQTLFPNDSEIKKL